MGWLFEWHHKRRIGSENLPCNGPTMATLCSWEAATKCLLHSWRKRLSLASNNKNQLLIWFLHNQWTPFGVVPYSGETRSYFYILSSLKVEGGVSKEKHGYLWIILTTCTSWKKYSKNINHIGFWYRRKINPEKCLQFETQT